MSDTRTVIATDGSCLNNPGPGGWAWAISPTEWAAGATGRSTNNAMELHAVYEALRASPESERILIRSDSLYVINACTKWIIGWRRANWVKKDGSPIMNLDSIRAIAELLEGRDVQWQHVRGHSGDLLNEFVDGKARAAAETARRGRPVDAGPGRSRARSSIDPVVDELALFVSGEDVLPFVAGDDLARLVEMAATARDAAQGS